MVTQEELLTVLRELVAEIATKVTPALAKDGGALRERVDAMVGLDSPLQQLGWDSVQMTWLLIRLEERFEIDTSSVSLFEMFTVGDLVRALLSLINEKDG
jgi:acyl carrier protein